MGELFLTQLVPRDFLGSLLPSLCSLGVGRRSNRAPDPGRMWILVGLPFLEGARLGSTGVPRGPQVEPSLKSDFMVCSPLRFNTAFVTVIRMQLSEPCRPKRPNLGTHLATELRSVPNLCAERLVAASQQDDQV